MSDVMTEWWNARRVRVEEAEVTASEAEYAIATMPDNTPIEWGGGGSPGGPFGGGEPSTGVGILLYSWWYDGVIAEVQTGGRRIGLFAARKGFWVKRLDDLTRLEGPGLNGDGI